jgi:CubicO group peptidase (beta-lactamase class C family)
MDIVKSKISKRIQIQRFDLYDFKGLFRKTTGKTLDILVQENFYRSLGMNNTSFNPLESLIKIEFRQQKWILIFEATLQGYVNDLSAGLEGGVSGHAGVFSNAMDVAKIMELYLKKEITAINSIFLKK